MKELFYEKSFTKEITSLLNVKSIKEIECLQDKKNKTYKKIINDSKKIGTLRFKKKHHIN